MVVKTEDAEGTLFLPRNIDDAPLDDQEGDAAGYLTPTGDGDPDYLFTGDIESYPEDWREERYGVERLRANRKRRVPEMVTVLPDGHLGSPGKSFWFIPGKFGFCPCCLDQPHPSMRERTKLAGLSGEGRSSATTLLVATALEWMNRSDSGVPKEKRKLLGFTDNRQDAALQAGHFNDFLFVSLLRGAILRAVLDVGDDGLTEDEFGLRIVRALGFTAANRDTRVHWMLDPEAGAVVREDAQRSLQKVLAHRLWTDLRRGWRYTNPSLSVLKLIDVEFIGLDDIAEDTERLAAIRPEFGALDATARKVMLKKLLGAMLEGLAVGTEALDPTVLEGVAQKSRNLLRAPWAIDIKETPRSRTTLFLQAPGKDQVSLREEQTIVRAGHNSRIGRLINRKSVIGTKLGKTDYLTAITGLMDLLVREGLVSCVELEDFDDARYRERLARHFVQRRRIDLISGDWDEDRAFPKHETTEFAYRLTEAHRRFQEAVLDYCFGIVSRAGSGQRERRLAFWGTLALMRCVGSSPAAALSALRNRMATESDRLEPQIYDEDSDDEDAVDLEPGTAFDVDPELLALVKEAEALIGRPDPKLTALVDALTPLIKRGANPVVFCRFLATAEHVRDGLRKAFPKLVIEAVTGVLTPDERRDRVADMATADDEKPVQHILVATDCLSEGINLQQLFDTVIHYDLSWNPTRHQQREGRVDRFGQPAELVRSIMMFSPDSAIDGAVLEVILRKAEEIRKATGVTVPLPAFLIHDSPREADLDGQLYARLFSLVHQWEREVEAPCFQYIVTTTTAPPPELQGDRYVRLVMSSTPAERRLFAMDI